MNSKIKSLGIAVLYCVLFRLSFGLGGPIKDAVSIEYYWYALGAFGTLSILLLTWAFLRFEKKSFADIGLKWESKTPIRFGKGFLIGVAISCTMLWAIIVLGDLKIEWAENYELPSFLLWSLAFIPLAFMEEVAFRSYPFVKLHQDFGLRFTQVVLAILFAFYHLGEDSIVTIFIGPGVWAFVYGMAAVYSKGISLPTGLHFGANFVLAILGDKKGIDPILIVDYAKEATPEMIAHTETLGIIIQFVLLVGALVAMELYLRRHKSDSIL